jgi:predicted aspartyl protease
LSRPFDLRKGLILVRARIWGPRGTTLVRLALDTGATSTLINASRLVSLGFLPKSAARHVTVTTGSRVERVAAFKLARLEALGHTRRAFTVLCHTLPPSASVDGLLGLDFLRGRRLVVDFRRGRIELI